MKQGIATKPMFLLLLLGVWVSSCGDLGRRYSTIEVEQGIYSPEIKNQFEELLQKYVRESDHQVFYKKWSESKEDSQKLKEVVKVYGRTDITPLSKNEKIAFYINAYNAITLELIVDNYEKTLQDGRRSIVNIGGWKIWQNHKKPVGGKTMSLDFLEKKVLVPLSDARVHFAVNCAAIGCPPLHREIFRGENLEETLDLLTRNFVNSNDPSHVQFNFAARKAFLNEVLYWYEEDFNRSYGSVRDFLAKFLKTEGPTPYVQAAPTASPEALIAELEFERTPYNWGLNEALE